MAAATNTVDIPFVYRALFLYYEPFGALLGSCLLHFSPSTFLNSMSQTAQYAPDNQVIYDNLAGAYALFAFNEAVLLRLTNDLRVWRGLFIGILLCDVLHLHASWAALGGEVFWDPRAWRAEDWGNLGSLWGQGAVRLAFLLGVGLDGVHDKAE
ncbi:hypothetical protein ACJ41O_012950 [Fusarium nematophilum]